MADTSTAAFATLQESATRLTKSVVQERIDFSLSSRNPQLLIDSEVVQEAFKNLLESGRRSRFSCRHDTKSSIGVELTEPKREIASERNPRSAGEGYDWNAVWRNGALREPGADPSKRGV